MEKCAMIVGLSRSSDTGLAPAGEGMRGRMVQVAEVVPPGSF